MRDAGPLHPQEFVRGHVRPVAPLVQLTPQAAHPLRRQGAPFLRAGVDLKLEVRKHRLAEEGRPNHVVVVAQEPLPLFLRLGGLQEVSQEQCLVRRRGHLREEDGVVAVDLGLVPVGVPAVHGVSHLVRQREDVVQGSVVVQQYVGVRGVGPPGVGPLALAPVLIDVHPPLREAALEVRHVVLP